MCKKHMQFRKELPGISKVLIFINVIDRELLNIASMGIERMLKESHSDIKLRKNAINMALQSLSNMMTNNPIIIKLLWPKVLNCSFLLA